MSGPALWYR